MKREMMGRQRHQLDHILVQIICTWLQTDNYVNQRCQCATNAQLLH